MFENLPTITAAKILFGIKYAEDWGRCSTRCQERIAKNATGRASAATEVNKGKMLAQYVKLNPDIERRINAMSISEET